MDHQNQNQQAPLPSVPAPSVDQLNYGNGEASVTEQRNSQQPPMPMGLPQSYITPRDNTNNGSGTSSMESTGPNSSAVNAATSADLTGNSTVNYTQDFNATVGVDVQHAQGHGAQVPSQMPPQVNPMQSLDVNTGYSQHAHVHSGYDHQNVQRAGFGEYSQQQQLQYGHGQYGQQHQQPSAYGNAAYGQTHGSSGSHSGKGSKGKGKMGANGAHASANANKFWTCLECGNINYGHRQTCNLRKCGAPKPANVQLTSCDGGAAGNGSGATGGAVAAASLPSVIEESNRNRKEMLLTTRQTEMGTGAEGQAAGAGYKTEGGNANGNGYNAKSSKGKGKYGDKGAGKQGAAKGTALTATTSPDEKVAGWICHQCYNFNYENRRTCNMRICNAQRPKFSDVVYWSAQEIEDYKVKKAFPASSTAAMNRAHAGTSAQWDAHGHSHTVGYQNAAYGQYGTENYGQYTTTQEHSAAAAGYGTLTQGQAGVGEQPRKSQEDGLDYKSFDGDNEERNNGQGQAQYGNAQVSQDASSSTSSGPESSRGVSQQQQQFAVPTLTNMNGQQQPHPQFTVPNQGQGQENGIRDSSATQQSSNGRNGNLIPLQPTQSTIEISQLLASMNLNGNSNLSVNQHQGTSFQAQMGAIQGLNGVANTNSMNVNLNAAIQNETLNLGQTPTPSPQNYDPNAFTSLLSQINNQTAQPGAHGVGQINNQGISHGQPGQTPSTLNSSGMGMGGLDQSNQGLSGMVLPGIGEHHLHQNLAISPSSSVGGDFSAFSKTASVTNQNQNGKAWTSGAMRSSTVANILAQMSDAPAPSPTAAQDGARSSSSCANGNGLAKSASTSSSASCASNFFGNIGGNVPTLMPTQSASSVCSVGLNQFQQLAAQLQSTQSIGGLNTTASIGGLQQMLSQVNGTQNPNGTFGQTQNGVNNNGQKMMNMPGQSVAHSIAAQMTNQFITPGSSPTNGNDATLSLSMNPNPFTNGNVAAFTQNGQHQQNMNAHSNNAMSMMTNPIVSPMNFNGQSAW